MSKIDNLKKSLHALSVKNAILVKNLMQIKQQQGELKFSFVNTQRGELNLFYDSSPSFHLHDPQGAIKSETPWIHSLAPEKKVIFIFGTGLGYSYILLRKWLSQNPHNTLVYLEPHLGVLFHLFQTETGTQMAQHPRVHFYTFGDKNELNYLLHYLAAYFSHYNVQITALPSYQVVYPDLCTYYTQELAYNHSMVTTRIIESKTSFHFAMRNTLNKMSSLSGHIKANRLKRHFDQIPCIIVGAGPSLKKNQDILKTLRQKALILAGSSAIPATNYLNVEPHFGTYLDPYQRVHERFIKTTSFEMPSFHSARTYLETSKSIHGPKFYLKGSDEFPYINWLENELGFDGPLVKELISVTTFNTNIALMLGCNPIIYVGVDLAYTGNESYSSGVEKNFQAEKLPVNESENFQFNENVWSKDIFGQPILTKEAWKIESHFLSEIFKIYPNHTFINATEGGLGFLGAENMPLHTVKNNFLQNSFPLDEWIHTDSIGHVLENSKLPQQCYKLFKELKESFKRVQRIYKKVLKEIYTLEKANIKEKLKEVDEQFVYEAQVDISNEIAYQYLLTHQHQIIDTENLKTHRFFYLLSPDAPSKLKNEIQLKRLKTRFQNYLQVSEFLFPILEQAIEQVS